MSEIILYPTETVYGLGVNAFDKVALEQLFELKGRDLVKSVSWLVRDISDIEQYAELSPMSVRIIERWLPGPLTLVLPLRPEYQSYSSPDKTIGFRISSDLIAQKIITDFMHKYQAPLTCTSANLSGLPTLSTIPEILNQFTDVQTLITKVYDDGPRSGLASTVVSVTGDTIHCLREGAYSWAEIEASVG